MMLITQEAAGVVANLQSIRKEYSYEAYLPAEIEKSIIISIFAKESDAFQKEAYCSNVSLIWAGLQSKQI
jgi:hypothetical protein